MAIDQHEATYRQGMAGKLSEDEINENVRQYKAIVRNDNEDEWPGQDIDESQWPGQGEQPAQQYQGPQQTPIHRESPPTIPAIEPQAQTIPAQKPWWQPRVGLSDLAGTTGQAAWAAGLSGMAMAPPHPLAKAAGFVAGGLGAIIADEGTRRLQEQLGEVPGAIAGVILGGAAGGATGVSLRAKPMGPFKVPEIVEPTPRSTPSVVLVEEVPKGGAYTTKELITEPDSRIMGGPRGEGQFSTGSGKSLFGEGQTDFNQHVEPPMGMPPRGPKPKGELPEKYPTILERVATKEEQIPVNPKPGGEDYGSTTPEGKYVPPKDYTEQVTPSRWRQWWQAQKERWGQEMPVLKNVPDSPVISAVEATHVVVEDAMEAFTHQPWVKSLMKLGDNTKMAAVEKKIVDAWKSGRDWQVGLSDDLKEMFKLRQQHFAEENAIRRKWGMEEIPETPGPYLPRITDEDFQLMRSISRSQEGVKASTGVGPFGKTRVIETLDEGMKKGVTYKDWRHALLMREARGQVLRATDQMMTDLEKQGVIHRTKEAAEAASPTGKAYLAEGLPFNNKGEWWVRSNEEKQFLLQNLRSMGQGQLDNIRAWGQKWVRNPSLINPLPHIIKNMGLKLMQQAVVGGLNPTKVMKNVMTHRYGTPDMLEEFQNTMPFTKSGRTTWEIMEEAGPKSMIQQMSRVPGKLNNFARRKIFAEWDPAMRYGLWREYINKGMSPQEAANHTWIDLIRYGTRADRIDAWNSVPFNFFVPWRVGTVRTMSKAFQTAPVRAGLFMGAVDMIREMDYRYNGRWTHLPYDYLERPIMTLMKEGKGPALETMLATIVAGPGGEYLYRTLEGILKTAQGKGGIGDIRTMAWGIAQMYDLWPQYEAFQKDGKVSHVVDMLGLMALGRHGTPYGAPHRFMEDLIPESVMPKSSGVKVAEQRKKAVEAKGDIRDTVKTQRDIYKYNQPMSP